MDLVDQGVREIMGAVFGVNPKSIDATASPDTIEIWDSLRHLNLILALEEHFNIQFTLDEVEVMDNYNLIVTLVSQHTNHNSNHG